MTFIEQVTSDLISRGWDRLRHYTVVFPMHRASLFMKDALKQQMLAAALDQPVIAPRFTTINELIDDLAAPYLQPDEEIRSVCLLHRIFCRQTGLDVSLDVFYGWGKQLLTDFSNADASEVAAEKLFANSADARQLEVTHLDEDTRQRLLDLVMGPHYDASAENSLRARLMELWKHLPDIYAEYSRRQTELGVASYGARLRFVVEHFDEMIAPQLEGRTFVFVGFNYLLGKERQLMQCLAPQSLFYWDHVSGFTTNTDAYKYTEQGIKMFGQALPVLPEPVERKRIDVIATAPSSGQALFVNEWLAKRSKEKGRVGIVIADETLLEPVIYSLPDTVSGEVNITKGFPLRNTKVFADIIAYLSDKRHDRKPDETYADVLRRLSASVAGTIDAERQPGERSWQQALIQESYYQAWVVINRFCSLIEDGTLAGITEQATLRNLLRRHLETVLLPFHGDPITRIQVIGVLETRLLDFDHLIVLNVEEGVLPKVEKDNSFIPYYLRKYYHMQTSGESAEVYAYNFFRLFRRCGDITLLFCDATDGNNKKSMSRFLMQVLTSNEFNVRKFRLAESSVVADTELDVSLLPEREQTLLARPLSPSAINTYITCPMRFYLQYIRGISDTEESGIVMQANEIGTLIHRAVQYVYEQVCGTLPATLTSEQQQRLLDPTLLDKAILAGFDTLNEEYRLHHNTKGDYYLPEEHKLEAMAARRHVVNILQSDARDARRGLTIVSMEQPYYFSLPVPGVGDVRIGGRIDRLDIVDGHLRVLDYKTGKYKEKECSAPDLDALFQPDSKFGKVLQTLIYCTACAAPANSVKVNPQALPVSPALRFSVKKDHAPLPRIADWPVSDFIQEHRSAFCDLLARKVHEIFTATDYPKREDKVFCQKYCPFNLICARFGN